MSPKDPKPTKLDKILDDKLAEEGAPVFEEINKTRGIKELLKRLEDIQILMAEPRGISKAEIHQMQLEFQVINTTLSELSKKVDASEEKILELNKKLDKFAVKYGLGDPEKN